MLVEGGGRGDEHRGVDIVLTNKSRNQNDGVIVYINKRLSATASQVSLGDVYGISLDFTFYGTMF